ncbi:MAG: HD domain-containing protein [Candidatus Ranarchaeia archaeon]|jgi:HD superfamily phosphohydrolase
MRKPQGVMIRDSIHKTIRIPHLVKKLIDTPTFQRLKGIKQLGLANLLYPGANGTRFDHSLGVYWLATKTRKRLQDFSINPPKGSQCIGLDKTDFAMMEVAALLHDIGHAPFSHAIDELSWFNHEDATKTLILKSEISDILQESGEIDPKKLVEILQPQKNTPAKLILLSDIISGPLGLDMLDYLQRDALYTGVPYGLVDTDRLFETIELHPQGKPKVIVNDKGILPVESVFFSRFAMFQSVYLHHVVRIAHRMLQHAINRSLVENSGWLDQKDLLQMQDDEFLYRLQTEGTPSVTKIIDALKSRRLYKRVGQISWADLEIQKWKPNQIHEFVIQGYSTNKAKQLLKEFVTGIQEELTSSEDLLLDFPPLVSKTVSELDVRLRYKTTKNLLPFKNPGISAIGSFVERAYQLIWKIQLFGKDPVSDKKKKRVVDLWNSRFPKMQILS